MLSSDKGRRRRALHILFAAMAFLCIWSSAAPAQEKADPFTVLRQKLVADGFSAEAVSQLYSRPEVFVEADGVSRFFIHSEAKLNYDQFSSPESIEKAQRYLQENTTALLEAEKAYGVDKRVITAILLVESRLGTVSGSRSALNILSTLAALTDPAFQESFWRIIPPERRISRERFNERVQKRAEWGYRELKALLRYTEREGMDPTAIASSYAGAVGYAQFMPTNILAYAQDGDQDGRIDLLVHADAIASIANYLKRHGWRPGISREQQEKAIYAYNPSSFYVNAILKVADLLKA
jgi:membrane-bound lytic murein transglycosylase B